MAGITKIWVTVDGQQCLQASLLIRLERNGVSCLPAVSPCSLRAGCVSTMPLLADGKVAVNMHSYGLSERAVGKEIP